MASNDTPAYALSANGRYLASYDTSDSEGGPDADFEVTDLRTRKNVAFLNAVCCPGVPSFRVGDDGTLVAGGVIKRPGRRAIRIGGRDPALVGGTVYWTDGVARSTVLDGVRGARRVADARAGARAPPPRAVHLARGTTVAATPHVRVVRRGGGCSPAATARPAASALPACRGSPATAGCSTARA